MGACKKLYLYNPINNTKQVTDYDLLAGITGRHQRKLALLKTQRMKIPQIGCYIIDDSFSIKELYSFMEKVKINDEIWKDVNGTNGVYRVSNYGRVARVYKKRIKILMPYTKFGRPERCLTVKICSNCGYKEYTVHRLVAEHFIENENNLSYIWHKNEDNKDNFAGNLQWVSKEFIGKVTGVKAKSRPVLKLDPITLEVLEEYKSMAEAGRQNYLHPEAIRECVTGVNKTSGGFKWIDKPESYTKVDSDICKVKCNHCGHIMDENDIKINNKEQEYCPRCMTVGMLMDLEEGDCVEEE